MQSRWDKWIEENMPEDLKKEMQEEVGEKINALYTKRKELSKALLDIRMIVNDSIGY